MARSWHENEPARERLSDIDRRVREALDALGVEYTPVACDPDLADTAAFCAAYGYDTGDSANTIIVQTRDKPPRHAACVLLATTRLDVNGAVRRRLGRKSSFADAGATVELTGMTLGGVTAVGLPPGLPLWIDSRVMARDRVILGAGSRAWKIIAPPGFLATLPGAEVGEGLARQP
jgi:prolyl-tRNA editing enzyme YbaK/EbsC (Cys-tRNA(Pro) deacylase)